MDCQIRNFKVEVHKSHHDFAPWRPKLYLLGLCLWCKGGQPMKNVDWVKVRQFALMKPITFTREGYYICTKAKASWKYHSMRCMMHHLHIGGLVQKRRNSSALAMELRQSCTNPSISSRKFFMNHSTGSFCGAGIVRQNYLITSP